MSLHLALLLAAAASEPAARRVETIDLAYCLDVATRGTRPDPGRCPAFIVDSLAGGLATCREAGGRLVPVSVPQIWALDVNSDGQSEYVFELGANVGCEGAYSIFECGSLGCPQVLYEQRDGAWRDIAYLDAGAAESIELLAPAPGTPYRELRVGCAGEDPCNEFAHYPWTGERYTLERLEVRGHWVQVEGAAQGLRGLTGEVTLRATPAPAGSPLGRYGGDTEVVILGEAKDAPYYYVSPCNACESGFIEKSSVRAP